MTMLKCFLGWRSYIRYEMSEISQLEGGGTKSAISYLDVIDSVDNGPNAGSYYNTQDDNQSVSHRQGQRSSTKNIAIRYKPINNGNVSTPALSYINTEQESPLFAQKNDIIHKVASQSSLSGSTSMVHSS